MENSRGQYKCVCMSENSLCFFEGGPSGRPLPQNLIIPLYIYSTAFNGTIFNRIRIIRFLAESAEFFPASSGAAGRPQRGGSLMLKSPERKRV